MVSSATGRVVESLPLDPSDWLSGLDEPSRLERGKEALRRLGCDVLLDIGFGTWASLLARAAQLYVKGVPVDWDAFFRGSGHRKVALPTYPFQRERHWPGTRPAGP